MRSSPFLGLQLRHAAIIYVASRVLLTGALAWMHGADRTRAFQATGVEYVVSMPLLTLALLWFDQLRAGAPILFANLGMGRRVQLGIGAALAFALECTVLIAAP